METTLERQFLEISTRKLRLLASRIHDCLGKLDEDQIWARGVETENAIGNLILHLSGNVRQWIISGIGGQPDVRVRDREFATRDGVPTAELLEKLEGTVNEAVPVIEGLTPARLVEPITIQSYNVTVMEAIYHVVEHFAQHTGQIVFATKMLTGEDLGFYRHLSKPAGHSEKTP